MAIEPGYYASVDESGPELGTSDGNWLERLAARAFDWLMPEFEPQSDGLHYPLRYDTPHSFEIVRFVETVHDFVKPRLPPLADTDLFLIRSVGFLKHYSWLFLTADRRSVVEVVVGHDRVPLEEIVEQVLAWIPPDLRQSAGFGPDHDVDAATRTPDDIAELSEGGEPEDLDEESRIALTPLSLRTCFHIRSMTRSGRVLVSTSQAWPHLCEGSDPTFLNSHVHRGQCLDYNIAAIDKAYVKHQSLIEGADCFDLDLTIMRRFLEDTGSDGLAERITRGGCRRMPDHRALRLEQRARLRRFIDPTPRWASS